MRVLILSFYYYPDLCAGSFRCSAFVEQLRMSNIEIEVITTLPNRYASFNIDAPLIEQQQNVLIQRVRLPHHTSGMIDQAKAFFYFAKAVRQLIKNKNYDLVFATSSRLMTAVLGAWVSNRKQAKLYLDIRDIFVDTIQDILSPKIAIWAKPLFMRLERYAFQKANKINIVSRGFQEYFKEKYPTIALSYFTNGIDPEFMNIQFETKNLTEQTQRMTVLYAGNIGEGQGLHHIVPKLAVKMADTVHFKIIGDGGRKDHLINAVKSHGCQNVEILPPVNRKQLIMAYQQADILFLHLNHHDAFLKVLPSKIFEYAALGKPIWAGVSGYAAEFIKLEITNTAIFPPCHADIAEETFHLLQLKREQRTDFINKYSRINIMHNMAIDVLSLVNSSLRKYL